MPLLIKNGLVCDGSGSQPQKQDILIQGDRIVRIGDLQKSSRDEVLDASGNMVVPGFIDVFTHVDKNSRILSHPHLTHFIEEGVTTVIGGNSGISAAPFFRGGDSIWKHEENIGWSSVKDFFSVLSEHGIGANMGMLVGYNSIRNSILRDTPRDLTDPEMKAIEKTIDTSLSEGALGVSLDLTSQGNEIPIREIESLLRIVKRQESVVAISLEGERDVLKKIRRMVRIAKKSGVRVEINSLVPSLGPEKPYREGREFLEKQKNASLHFDIPPFPVSAFPVSTLLPDWVGKNLEEKKEAIKLARIQERLLPEWQRIRGDSIVIGNLPHNLEFLEGKTLRDFSDSLHISQERGLLKLLEVSDMKAICFLEHRNEELFREFLNSSKSILASHAADFAHSEAVHKRYRKKLKRIFEEISEDPVLVGVLVSKLSGVPAEHYNIRRRGFLKEGYYADIVILENSTPREVLVNGKRAMKEGSVQKTLSGKMVRRIKA